MTIARANTANPGAGYRAAYPWTNARPRSVHTTPAALRTGEAHILSLRERLLEEGRL
jgi:hypothetical protein